MRKRVMKWLTCMLLCAGLCLPAASESAELCADLAAVRERLRACAAEQAEKLYLPCEEAVYQELMADDATLLYAMLGGSGVADYQLLCHAPSASLLLSRIRYYPGMRIARAAATGREETLSADESAALAAARRVAREALRDTPLETERALHERLASDIAYAPQHAPGRIGRGDTAIGALLDGQADCDGYADAFYLTATLAGLQAEYQFGFGITDGRAVPHQWNRVCLSGTWYFVDCCWDRAVQADGSGKARLRYFNLGADWAAQSYRWESRAHDQPIADKTDAALR